MKLYSCSLELKLNELDPESGDHCPLLSPQSYKPITLEESKIEYECRPHLLRTLYRDEANHSTDDKLCTNKKKRRRMALEYTGEARAGPNGSQTTLQVRCGHSAP